ncbi:MAG: thioredoxin domain-containing protein [Actinomycetaceae bacterium]|nr:thioredoxin domain-containing protein [Actinomycetaceae bacterium]
MEQSYEPQVADGDKSEHASGSSTRTIAIVILSFIVIAALAAGAFYAGQGLSKAPSNNKSAQQNNKTPSQSNGSGKKTTSSDAHNGQFAQAAPRVEDEKTRQALLSLPNRDHNSPRSLGDAKAPVVMMAFSDYSCPLCAAFEKETFPQLKHYIDDGVLRFEFYNAPIFATTYASDIGARGGIAASQQDKFFEFLSVASAQPGHTQWTPDIATEFARQAGVKDIERFQKDLQSDDSQQALNADAQLSQQLGIQGTPFFIINDRVISGNQPIQIFVDTIEAAHADATVASR